MWKSQGLDLIDWVANVVSYIGHIILGQGKTFSNANVIISVYEQPLSDFMWHTA